MMTDEQLNDMALMMAIQVVKMTMALNGELHSELQKISNISQDIYSVNLTWIDIAYFGLYIFYRKNPNLRLQEVKLKFDPILKEKFIFAVTNVGYSLPEQLKEKTKHSMETDGWYELAMQEYSNYRGDIALLFKDRLLMAFNGENSTSKIKFINDEALAKLTNKWSFKILSPASRAEAMKKAGLEYAFPESVLYNIAKNIAKTFEEEELLKSE